MVMFLHMSVIPFTGGCMPRGGVMYTWGHACLGGVHAWGHACQGVMGVCAQGAGMHAQEHACLGACMPGVCMPQGVHICPGSMHARQVACILGGCAWHACHHAA